jgi:hypothetical protein
MKGFWSCSVCICIALSLAHVLLAQDSHSGADGTNFPVIPVPLALRHVQQFFHQTWTGTSTYSGIEALVDNSRKEPWYEIILRDGASGKYMYYCNSKETVNTLTGQGKDAYFTPIVFSASPEADSHPAFTFEFHDNSGKSIQWKFLPGAPRSETTRASGFVARADDDGLVLLHGNRILAAAAGTTVAIGAEQHAAGEGAYDATDVLIAEIQPITENWSITTSPAQLRTGGEWVLSDPGGQERRLTIQQISGDQIKLNMADPKDSASTAQLAVQQSGGQFELRDLTVIAQDHNVRISFDPALPLPAPMAKDKKDVKFIMDEDSNRGVTSGSVSSVRGLGDEHLQWHFDSPDWAKALQFETGVNIVPGVGAPAKQKAQ